MLLSSRHRHPTGFVIQSSCCCCHHTVLIPLSWNRRHCVVATQLSSCFHCHTILVMPLWSFHRCCYSSFIIRWSSNCRRHAIIVTHLSRSRCLYVIVTPSSLYHCHHLKMVNSLSSCGRRHTTSVVPSASFLLLHCVGAIQSPSSCCDYRWPWQASALAKWDDSSVCRI